MRGARLSAPDARDYERMKEELAKAMGNNQRLLEQNTQANAEIARLTFVVKDLEKMISSEPCI